MKKKILSLLSVYKTRMDDITTKNQWSGVGMHKRMV
jgi:hypothetical protein